MISPRHPNRASITLIARLLPLPCRDQARRVAASRRGRLEGASGSVASVETALARGCFIGLLGSVALRESNARAIRRRLKRSWKPMKHRAPLEADPWLGVLRQTCRPRRRSGPASRSIGRLKSPGEVEHRSDANGDGQASRHALSLAPARRLERPIDQLQPGCCPKPITQRRVRTCVSGTAARFRRAAFGHFSAPIALLQWRERRERPAWLLLTVQSAKSYDASALPSNVMAGTLIAGRA